ncbi:unnamed protein product [Orchesella dallaii]|uniref:Uncharacterized protein n=1 Tax=Orchesella dallaii TaxID=48710 RepID=A0ABP1RCW2_9HEXA
MNTSSKTIILTVLLVCLSIPAIFGSPPATIGCTRISDVGNPCRFKNATDTCLTSGGERGSSLTCCHIEVQTDEGRQVLECRCCLPSDQCEQCDALE